MSDSIKKVRTGFKTWVLIWGLGIAGQLCWNIENQWFNTFIYAKIAKDPAIISWMVGVTATATTFATFFFGTLADRMGTRKPFVSWGYIMWGICTIAFGLTEFIPKEQLIIAAIMVVVADAVMSFFGSMGNDAGFNAWTNDMMHDGNRGQIGAALATQPVIGTIVGTLLGGAIIGTEENYMRLFLIMGGLIIAVMFTVSRFADIPADTHSVKRPFVIDQIVADFFAVNGIDGVVKSAGSGKDLLAVRAVIKGYVRTGKNKFDHRFRYFRLLLLGFFEKFQPNRRVCKQICRFASGAARPAAGQHFFYHAEIRF